MNRFLHIDLTTHKYHYGTPDQEILEQFIGGKGAGLKLLFEMGLVTHDPFSCENPLIFITGPFTGSRLQTSARSALVTKSPLTGTFLDSNVGGNLGPMIKKAGLDYIIITGRSPYPIYLNITSHEVKFQDARYLWSQGIFQTEKTLKSHYPQARIASIGPAGENRVRYACIGTDYYRQFGRGGAGAVMGSKNLKAVVIQGQEKIEYDDQNGFTKLNRQLTKDVLDHPERKLRYELGTPLWIKIGQEGRFLPTRNFQQTQFEKYEDITSQAMQKTLNWKKAGCFNCVIKCAKLASWDNLQVEGPEYETTAFLGSNCGIGNAKSIARANYLCDDLGLDTISTGAVIAFAMEAFEKGMISPEDTDDIELTFGNQEALFYLIDSIAHRRGLGDLLSEGTRIASQKLASGSEYFAIQTAGMEISGVNIKGCASMALGLATADFASHTRIWTVAAEMNGQLNFDNTPAFVIEGQDKVNTRNSLIVCDFLPYGFDRLAGLLEKLTGIKITADDLQKTGERISNLARWYNLKNGRTRKDDTVPQRFFKEKHQAGIFAGTNMTEKKFNYWLDMYYQKRGWNSDGVPTEQKMRELNLEAIPARTSTLEKLADTREAVVCKS